MDQRTIQFYEDNAETFISGTVNADMHEARQRFMKLLPSDALILDFGCGSGRDTKYFLGKGYSVEAIDGSEELVKIARENTGIEVKQMLFQDLNETERYDGIFACASILHVPYTELPDIMRRMHQALKESGIAYISFKYGTFEGERNGRYFTDLNEEKLQGLLKEVTGFTVESIRITGDARPGRSDEKWLNVILRKERYD